MEINFSEWEDIKTFIHSRLLNANTHAIDHLAKKHVTGDIYNVFYIGFTHGDEIIPWDLPISLFKTYQDEYGVTIDDLEKLAQEHSVNLKFERFSQAVMTYMHEIPPWADMVIVTNESWFCGASVILDPTVQRQLSERFPNGYYVILSSVCESIAVSADVDLSLLKETVKHANETLFDPYRLSDKVYKVENGTLVYAD